jgi:hypothetical protein
MPVTDAVVLRNFFPFPYAVVLRKGWKEFTTGLAESSLPTVAVYEPVSGAPTIVAFSGGNVYALTIPGAAPSPLETGMTNDYWQTVMFANAGNNYLYAVNGADEPLVYDGASFTTVTEVAPPATGFDVSGVDPADFIHVCVHQRRLWFVEKDSTQAWYLPVDQIGGDAEVFPVGQLFPSGGFLMAIYTWTLDAGSGLNDKLVFVSSQGDVAIYSGTDPADADLWSLEGVINIGAPVGRRCGMKYGGDLLLITTNGVLPLSIALQSTRVNTADNLTDKIQHTISALVSSYKDLPGWELLLFPNENQVWLVVPVPDDVQVFSMNTITGAWAQFDGMNIRSSALYLDNPVFITTDGRVCRAWQGYFDNVPFDATVGDRIEAEAVTAYNYFGLLGQTKRWTMARAIFQSGSIPAGALNIVVDYAIVGPLEVPTPAVLSGDYLWDEALWDESTWDTPYERYRLWRSVDGLGYAAALHLKILQGTQTEWVATDFVFEPGGVL